MAARKKWLRDGLHEALDDLDLDELKRQLHTLVPRDVQRILAKAGIRDEELFPTPAILRARPTLLGYYRLLLGLPQKQFYAGSTGLGLFKSLEVRGSLSSRHESRLEELCREMAEQLAELVRRMTPDVTSRDVAELPLLTLGSQFYGANNNRIGQEATLDVFLGMKEIVASHTTDETENRIGITNASGRKVWITLAADPDVRIEEEFGDELRHRVAIEIKGGTDRSNAHNRAGEAEKSHQKAKGDGFREFWTVIAKQGLEMRVLRSESPTTNSWFDVAHLLSREGSDWREFLTRVAGEVGIPYE